MALQYVRGPQRPDPYYYNPAGWDSAYRAALASCQSTYVPIYGLGDSILRGGQSDSFQQKSWWLLLMRAIKAAYGDGGPGLRYITDTLDPNFYQGTLDLPKPDGVHGPWNFSAAVANAWNITSQPYGIGGLHYYAPAGSGAQATLLESFVGLDLYANKTTGGGSLALSIDGVAYDQKGVALGSAGPLSLHASTVTYGVKIWSVRGLSNGLHTLMLTQLAAPSGSVNVGGAVCYGPSGGGILPMRLGRSGMAAVQAFGNVNADSISLTLAMTPKPALVIFEYGTNDMQWGYSFSEFEAICRRVAEAVKSQGASLLFVLPCWSTLFGWKNADLAHKYVAKIYSVAHAYNCAVYDLNAAWTDLGASYLQTTFKSSTPHPNNAGHADIAMRLSNILL